MKALSVVMGLALAFALVVSLQAAEKKEAKEVTLKGSITCAKCDLKLKDAKACATVIQVKDGDKETVYYFDADSHKKYHKDICKEAKDGSVKGTVSEKGGKKVVTVKELEYK